MKSREKILLVLLPFWPPLIPPIGIACLKSYLQQHNYEVKTLDANVEIDFNELYDKYFEIMRQNVPESKQGNFLSVGHDILRNHMTAYLNYTDEQRYRELVNLLINNTYYCQVEPGEIEKLHRIVKEIYKKLKEYVIRILERENPGILGLSVFSDTLAASQYMFKLTREIHPHIRTVMGGPVFADYLAQGTPNFEIFQEKTRDYIDKIIIGEGELLILKWLRGELPEAQRVYTLDDINREILDLSTVKIPEMRDFDIGKYTFTVSYASRSCPYQCSFCSETIQWGKYRKKRSLQVVEELKELSRRHHTQLFLLSDSLLNPVIQDLAGEFLKSPDSLYWGGWLRVDKHVCEIENTLRWRRAGFYHARLGIESGSQQVLELMGKHIPLEQIRGTVSSLATVGIKTTTLWVVGHPGETGEDFQKTLDLIEEMRNDIYEAECRPFYFYLSGQVGTRDDRWENMKRISLYPKETEDMLLYQTWLLECDPPREVIYKRMNRFVQHCKRLGIPNPYSMHDIYKADERWKKLHKNAVPPVVEFKQTGKKIDENKHVKKINYVKAPDPDEKGQKEYMDFGF